MKALITHCTSAVAAWKLVPIAGSATLSTEPSMKARLEARMQVARTRRGCRALPPGAAMQEAPSQGAGRARLTALQNLEQPRRAHAAADTHRHHHVAGAAALALDQGVAGHPRARHAVGMADRDRAAIDVHPVVGNAEHVLDVEHLHRERLV